LSKEAESANNPRSYNSNQKVYPLPTNTGKVNHVSTKMTLEEPEVMLATFDVNSTPATVLFDYGGSNSFISQAFVRTHSIPFVP
jgi:hypothetical protein